MVAPERRLSLVGFTDISTSTSLTQTPARNASLNRMSGSARIPYVSWEKTHNRRVVTILAQALQAGKPIATSARGHCELPHIRDIVYRNGISAPPPAHRIANCAHAPCDSNRSANKT